MKTVAQGAFVDHAEICRVFGVTDPAQQAALKSNGIEINPFSSASEVPADIKLNMDSATEKPHNQVAGHWKANIIMDDGKRVPLAAKEGDGGIIIRNATLDTMAEARKAASPTTKLKLPVKDR